MSTNGDFKSAPPVANTSKNAKPNSNPVKQIVEVLKRVDLKNPDAAKNEISVIDKNGKRIKLTEDEVRFDYFKGRFVRKVNK